MVDKAYISKDCGKELVERLAAQDYCLSILIEVISKINPKSDDPKQLQNIKLNLSDLKDFMQLGDTHAISKLKNSIRKIKQTLIDFEDGRYWEPISFFDRAIIDKQTSIVHASINPKFQPHLTNLKEFLVLSRNAIKANLRSVRLYTYLRSIHKDYPKKISLEQIQASMQTNYPSYGTFKQQFLIPIIEDLKKAGINLYFSENKGKKNKVISLDFSFNEPKDIQDKMIATATKQEKKQFSKLEPKPQYLRPQPIPTNQLSPEEQEQARQAFLDAKSKYISNLKIPDT